MYLLNRRTLVSVTFSLIISLCLLSTLFVVNTSHAQPQTNKVAIVFEEVEVISSGTAFGCANWELYAYVTYSEPFTSRNIGTIILESCVNEGATYPLRFPKTAIVEEYPSNGWRDLHLFGFNEGWLGDDRLAPYDERLTPPDFMNFYTALARYDYSVNLSHD